MKFTEEQLRGFAASLGETENQKCLKAIGMVKDALKNLGFTDDNKSISLLEEETYAYSLEMRGLNEPDRKIKIFIQGSYANNTNVRTQSDVDIAVVQEYVFHTKYREGVNDSHYKFRTVPTANKSFKDEVEICLRSKFGNDVERKNKSIKINGNTYRTDADTVPCKRFRDYTKDYRFDENNYIGGIFINADDGQRIINYPEQHISNGKKKNSETDHYYKKMVRIIKKIRYIMIDEGYSSACKVSSFGLESLLWNIPNEVFKKYPIYTFIFEDIVDYLYNDVYLLNFYKEANGIKFLCSTREDIEVYQKFITDLKNFYSYEM